MIRLRAPAKLNLCLYVGPTREDGLHGIASIFEPLELADELRVSDAEGTADEVICAEVGGPNLVEKALGRWAEADRHLTDALKGGQDPWIHKNLTVLEKTLAEVKRQVARIEITGEPVGADVLVNGRPVGKVPLPHPVRVNAGSPATTALLRALHAHARTIVHPHELAEKAAHIEIDLLREPIGTMVNVVSHRSS